MALKIGILLDGLVVPNWQVRLVEQINANPAITIKEVYVNEVESTRKPAARKVLYKLLRRFDRSAFGVPDDCFVRQDLSKHLDCPVVFCRTKREGHFTIVSADDITRIRAAEIDVLLRFGFGILKGDILRVTREGVWSLHHGDNSINRGGPPAFWEVVNREGVTGITLQRLTEQLDGGDVLDKSFVRTDFTSFNRNQNNVFRAGNELLLSALASLADGVKLNPENRFEFYSYRLYKDPKNWEVLGIFSKYITRILSNLFFKFFFTQQWVMLIRKGNNTALFQYRRMTAPHQNTDWADPFLVRYNDKLAVFFEEKKRGHKGRISCLLLNDHGKMVSSVATPVISEEYHLSYPFPVFHDNNLYLVPESAESGAVWLYRCEEFPKKWARFRRLLSRPLFDPTLFEHEGIWYLMGTQRPHSETSADQYLFLYYTKDLMNDEWLLHPMSPLSRDVRGARPAGAIFNFNGRLIRPGQVGAPKYGYGVRFFEIQELSPSVYKEVPLQDIQPLWSDDLLATHTWNQSGDLTVADAQIRRFRFF